MTKVAIRVTGNGSVPDVAIGGRVMHLNANATLANDTLLETILHINPGSSEGIVVVGSTVKDSQIFTLPPGD